MDKDDEKSDTEVSDKLVRMNLYIITTQVIINPRSTLLMTFLSTKYYIMKKMKNKEIIFFQVVVNVTNPIQVNN